MSAPSKQPPASLWAGLTPPTDQWVVFSKQAPDFARYIRAFEKPALARVTLYGLGELGRVKRSVPVASIAVPHDGNLTVAQRQELANAMLQIYVMTFCPSSE